MIRMITKRPWPTRKNDQKSTGYNPRKQQTYVITDAVMTSGQTYMEAEFTRKIAPLIVINGVKFEIIPLNGDVNDVTLGNMLLSGPGKRDGLTEECARAGEILRLEYDSDTDEYSYIYKLNGVNQELRSRQFARLRKKISESTRLQGLKNKKYLLTIAEYTRLYDDYVAGIVHDDANFDICSYKYEQIIEK